MGKQWKLQEARDHLSELVRRAREDGPQVITVRGQEQAVLLSCEEYARLRGDHEDEDEPGSALSLLELFQNSPLRGVELDLERDRETAPDPVDLSG